MINLIILIALISAANASMYSSTRILWYLSETRQAPKFIQTINIVKKMFYYMNFNILYHISLSLVPIIIFITFFYRFIFICFT
jgi:L-asparagine transporter-like permease